MVKQIAGMIVVVNHRKVFLTPKMIDDQIVGDTHHPGYKTTILSVATVLQRMVHFYKSILKEVLGEILLAHHHKNIGKHLLLVSFEQHIKAFLFTGNETFYKFFVQIGRAHV